MQVFNTLQVIIFILSSESPPPHYLTHLSLTHFNTHMYTAGLDYQETRQNLTFTSEGSQSVLIPILDDTVVEDTESFLALLSTSDDFVVIGQDPADVFIQDNDGNST